MYQKLALASVSLAHTFPHYATELVVVHRLKVERGVHELLKDVCILSKDLNLICQAIIDNQYREAARGVDKALGNAELF